MHSVSIRRRRKAALAFVAALVLLGLSTPQAVAFDLFARHEVTAQFATQNGKPMANAEVQVFAPGDPQKPVITGRTDAQGKFTFAADRDGFWSAEARDAGSEIARVMIRVGAPPPGPEKPLSPAIVIGILVGLLVMAVCVRLLRARNRRSRRPR